jgi:hypothetical protein
MRPVHLTLITLYTQKISSNSIRTCYVDFLVDDLFFFTKKAGCYVLTTQNILKMKREIKKREHKPKLVHTSKTR